MKITFFIGGLSGGGAERVVSNLSNYLTGKGHRADILTMTQGPESYHISNAVRRIPLIKTSEKRGRLRDMRLRLKRLRKYMKTSDTDVYIVMLPITIILLLAFSRYTGRPIIVSERADPASLAGWKKTLIKRLISRATGCVFQTEGAREWYRPYFNGKSVIIPNAVSEEFLSECETHAIPGSEKIIAGAGRLTGQKNFRLLIEAFADVRKMHPGCRLVIYGEGPQRNELEKLCSDLDISGSVSMPGYVTNIGEKLPEASIFVLSSDYEGMPNSLIEAMALGLPCIAADCPPGGPKALIKNGENGILVPPGNREALASAMEALICDPPRAAKLGENAKKIRETLAPEKIYKEWEDFISEIAAEHSHRD